MQITGLCLLKSSFASKRSDRKEGQSLQILGNFRSQILAYSIVLRYQITSSSLAHLAAAKQPGSILNREEFILNEFILNERSCTTGASQEKLSKEIVAN
jgi:hypothetical protein